MVAEHYLAEETTYFKIPKKWLVVTGSIVASSAGIYLPSQIAYDSGSTATSVQSLFGLGRPGFFDVVGGRIFYGSSKNAGASMSTARLAVRHESTETPADSPVQNKEDIDALVAWGRLYSPQSGNQVKLGTLGQARYAIGESIPVATLVTRDHVFTILFDPYSISFDHGTVDLTNRDSAVKAILDFTRDRDYRFEKILVIGHHDLSGGNQENETIAIMRSKAVRRALVALRPEYDGLVETYHHYNGFLKQSYIMQFVPANSQPQFLGSEGSELHIDSETNRLHNKMLTELLKLPDGALDFVVSHDPAAKEKREKEIETPFKEVRQALLSQDLKPAEFDRYVHYAEEEQVLNSIWSGAAICSLTGNYECEEKVYPTNPDTIRINKRKLAPFRTVVIVGVRKRLTAVSSASGIPIAGQIVVPSSKGSTKKSARRAKKP